VLCVPGLSANLCGFDRLAERLAGDALQLVAIDLRGRGRSEVTGAGTCGWRSHARDVLGIADAVGAPTARVVGATMFADRHGAERQRRSHRPQGPRAVSGCDSRRLPASATGAAGPMVLRPGPMAVVAAAEIAYS